MIYGRPHRSAGVSMNVGRMIVREVMKSAGRTSTYRRLQNEAASRPGSRRVHPPAGEIYMSPLEAQLYQAMQAEALSPIPQYCISGDLVDFAFPAAWLTAEA